MTERPWWAQDYVEARPLDDEGRWLVVMRLTFGRGRVTICTAANACIEAY